MVKLNNSKSKETEKTLSEEISETLFESEEIMIDDRFASFTVLYNNPALRKHFKKQDE